MQTVEKIINLNGGLEALKEKAIKVMNDPYMPLCIEYIGEGPRGLPTISVAHYYEQNGDLMRDPDMVFEIANDSLEGYRWLPVSWQNDGLGINQYACWVSTTGAIMIKTGLIKELTAFSKTWDKNLKNQGFEKAAALIVSV